MLFRMLGLMGAGVAMATAIVGSAHASTWGTYELTERYEQLAGEATLHRDRVLANTKDSYRLWISAGDTVTVAVSGDGDTDLDVIVRDPSGNEVASDTDGTDDCRVRFRAARSGRYQIDVKNYGEVYNDYVLFVS